MGSGLTLTNNEMEYIIKVIKSLKDRIILLKEIIKKVKNLKGGFLGNVLGPLIKAGSVLMKNALATLAKSVLIPLRLKAAASATDAVIQEKNSWIMYNYTDNLKERNA